MVDKNSGTYNRNLIEVSLDPLVTIGPDGKITDVNHATELITGYDRNHLIGTVFCNYFTDPIKAKKGYEEVFRKGYVRDYLLEIQNKNGKVATVLYNAAVYKDENGRVIGVFAAARDITERQANEIVLARTLRALRTISKCNEILVRANDERELLKNICSTIVKLGGYKMAWVGYAMDDKEKSVQPIEKAGYEAGYLKDIKISWANNSFGNGPTGRAIRSKKAQIEKNIRGSFTFAPWKEKALKRGYESSIALPFLVNKTMGALMVYSSEPDSFDKNEVTLLSELTRDLSFGIKSIRSNTERSKIQDALRVSSNYNRNLIEASLDPLVTIGIDGKITDVNHATEKATGRTRDELIGTNFSDYFTDHEKAESGYKKVFKEGQVQDYQLSLLHKSGLIIPVLYNASVYKDENGRIIGVFAAARDITIIQRVERALKESEQKYRLLTETSDDFILTHDVAGKIIYANRSTIQRFGWNESKLYELRLSQIVAPEYLDDMKSRMEKRLKGHKEVLRYETAILDSKNEKVPVEVSSSPILDNGKITSFLITARDISERKASEEKIQKSEKRFRETLDAMLEGCMIIGFDWKYIYVNDMAAKHGHAKKEDLIGKSILDIYPKVKESDIFKYYEKCMTSRKAQSFESSYVFPDGSVNWYEFSVQPVNEGIFVLSIDTTNKKKAEKEALERTEELQKMNNLMIGRELRMIELKKQIKELKKTP